MMKLLIAYLSFKKIICWVKDMYLRSTAMDMVLVLPSSKRELFMKRDVS